MGVRIRIYWSGMAGSGVLVTVSGFLNPGELGGGDGVAGVFGG